MKNIIVCGSIESSDVLIQFEVTGKPLEVLIESKVMDQFGKEIQKLVVSFCKENKLNKGKLSLNDQGAIDAVIKARILGIIEKLKEGNIYEQCN